MRHSEAIRQEGIELIANGVTYLEAARRMGVGHMTIWGWVNPERAKASKRMSSKRHPSYGRDYYAKNRELVKQKNKKYRTEHIEECRARDRRSYAEWDEARKEEHRKYMSEWRKSNPEKGRAKAALRRARVYLGMESLSQKEKDAVNRIYYLASNAESVECYLCGEQIPKGNRHVDHIYPLSKGGEHKASNLAIACASCNSSKGAKLPAEIGLLL